MVEKNEHIEPAETRSLSVAETRKICKPCLK